LGHGQGLRFGFGVDEVVEHLGEADAAGFFYVHGGGDFGDGSDGAELFVQFHPVYYFL